jgi:hypothetical protein
MKELFMKLHISALAVFLALAACQGIPAVPSITAYDQKYRYINSIEVNRVTSDGPGWVVVYAAENGAPGEVIGYAPVPGGTTSAVRVNIDASRATKVLYVKLHEDKGAPGVFEFSGPDAPVVLNGSDVMTSIEFHKEGPLHTRDKFFVP